MRDLAVGGDADRLVPEPFAGLAVGGEEPARGLPAFPPFGLGELGGGQVVPGAQQPLAAPHDAHAPGLLVGPAALEPVLEDVQAAGLGEPLCCERYPPGARFVPFSPIGRDRRCVIVRTPASRRWMWASWRGATAPTGHAWPW